MQTITSIKSIARKLSAGWRRWKKPVRNALYLAIMFMIALFLYKLGKAPWIHAIKNWPIFLLLTLTTGSGLVIQARAFVSVSTGPKPDIINTTRIWSASAVISVVAPLFAGIATRTTLLVKDGMTIRDCLSTSLRQVWMGVEYALLIAAISTPMTGIPAGLGFSAGLFIFWVALWSLRAKLSTAINAELTPQTIKNILNALARPVPKESHVWFILQIIAMSATYYIGFNGLGAELSLASAAALSALTVIVSIIAFVPNGLGITDALWVALATHKGLPIEQAVTVAILIRLSHLMAAGSLYLYLNKLRHHPSNNF